MRNSIKEAGPALSSISRNCVVIFLLRGIAAVDGCGEFLIRGVLIVFGDLLDGDIIVTNLSKDLLATPLFPRVIILNLVFGILLVFAGIELDSFLSSILIIKS